MRSNLCFYTFFVTKDPLSNKRGSFYFCQFAFCWIVSSFFVYFDYYILASLLFIRISVQIICNYAKIALQCCVFLMYNNSVWMTLFCTAAAARTASCSVKKRHLLIFVIFNYLYYTYYIHIISYSATLVADKLFIIVSKSFL